MGQRHVVEDFDLFGGLHCETSALRKVLNYHGLDISEEMLLGVGCGVGFLYWYMKRMTAPLVGGRGGRSEDLMENIAKAIEGTIARITTGSPKRAHSVLMERLGSGEPTVVFADIAFLPYMGVGEAGHFGGHSIVVYGIDEDQDVAMISDRANGPVSVTVDELKRARGSKFPPFAPKHAFLDVRHPKEVEMEAKDIERGIRHVVTGMLNPPISNAGLKGMDKWAKLVVQWPGLFRGRRLLDVLISGFIYIETGGTGGSSFRPMYSRFLQEARGVVGEPRLDEAAEAYRKAGEIWSEIARLYLPDSHPPLGRVRQLILEKDEVSREIGPNTAERLADFDREMDGLMADAAKQARKAPEFLPEVQSAIGKLKKAEFEAVHILQDIVS